MMDGIIKAFPGYEYIDGKNMYRGIDVSRGGYVYGDPGMYEDVGLLDSASHHPTSAIVMNAFGEYTKNFKDLLDARIAIKHHDFEAAGTMLDGRLKPYLSDEYADDLACALKIVINSVYGLSSASFPNPFKDPRNVNNIVALRGALFMKTLQDAVENEGYHVISVRTDSLKIANVDQKIIDFVMDFGVKYGYTFEHEATYDRMCLVDKANYIAKYNHQGIINKGGKHAGEWTATGAQFQHPYIFKTLFSKEELTFKDLCETKEVSNGGAIYLDFNEALPVDEHDYHFIGRVGLFVPIKPGCGGADLMVRRDDKYSAVTGTKGYKWLEAEQVRLMSLEDSIDMSYYHTLADKAIDAISKYGDFEHFVGEGEYVPEGGVA